MNARPVSRFVPTYGPSRLAGPGVVTLTMGARSYGIPAGARIGSPDDGDTRVALVITAQGVLHMLTSGGEVRNLPATAASALGDDVFGRPDARPPTP